MRIDSQVIGMESARSFTSTRMDAYSARILKGNGSSLSFQAGLFQQTSQNENGEVKEEKEKEPALDTLQKNADKIRERFEAMKTQASAVATSQSDRDAIKTIKTRCLNYLWMLLFGDKSELEELRKSLGETDFSGGGFMQQGQSESMAMSYSEFHYYEETEDTTFSTEGKVVTADGREISFQLELEMSREFVEASGITVNTEMNLCDPLVINLNDNIADVEDQKFRFDIDGDGELDVISKLGKNSGFLALDQNEDGIINDGTELFGTKSGNGFEDLAAYDEDGNGWIDENDAVFQKLLVWTKDSNGNDQLLSLKKSGVGAIYLGNSNTDFSLNQADNTTNAVIRKTGIFLYENGMTGTIQQVDFAKEDVAAGLVAQA